MNHRERIDIGDIIRRNNEYQSEGLGIVTRIRALSTNISRLTGEAHYMAYVDWSDDVQTCVLLDRDQGLLYDTNQLVCHIDGRKQ